MSVRPPIHVIEHPVYDRFGPGMPREGARRRLALGEDLELLLFFGLVRPYKGLDVLLEAMGELAARRPRLHLIVAGEFYEGRRAADEAIERLGIRDRVTLLDRYIPDDDVPLYFSAADVVVQPYRSATQSGVVQTAFQFGRPVIVTDVGALSRMVENGRDGLVVPPADPEALSAAVERFFDEEGLALRLTRGAAAAEDRMTWTEFTARLFE
jgi:glycosyltransferase involved in cell wall biosynthesis